MNERIKILQLLQDGKLTAEQADELLAALESRTERPSVPPRQDKWNLGELKNLGTQISSAVTQSLSEVKKVLEQQVDHLSTNFSGTAITVSHELDAPAGTLVLSAETTNGRIQVSSWNEPTVHIHVRGQVKTTRMSEAREALENAVQVSTDGQRFDVTVMHGKRDHGTGAQVVGAHLDIYVPHGMKQIFLRTQNGGLYVDSVRADELQADTVNGAVHVFGTSVERLHLNTENGRIELRDSVDERVRQVYAFTKNGTLSLEGMPEQARVVGSARTSFGKVDIDKTQFELDLDDAVRPTFVRFRSKAEQGQGEEVRLQFETKNGSIRVRG